jgi:hypothetical protein
MTHSLPGTGFIRLANLLAPDGPVAKALTHSQGPVERTTCQREPLRQS